MWDDLGSWFQSPGGARVLQTALVPALAILVAGVLAALIARAAIRSMMRHAERAEATAAVGALVAAARAVADADPDGSTRRRAARLRAEADVRTRLLTLPGATAAADWADARIDAVAKHAAGAPADARLGELRDGLVEWVGHPKRAKRIFAAAPAPRSSTPQTHRTTPSAEPAPAPAAEPAPQAPQASAPTPAPGSQDRGARAPGPRRTQERAPQPAPVQEAEPVPATAAATAPAPAAAAPEAPAPAPAPAPAVAVTSAPVPSTAEAVPAWQRTRAGERLQQERGRTRAADPADEDEASPGTAPIQLPHRTGAAPSADDDESGRLEAHQQARHALAAERARAASDAAAAAVPNPAPAAAPAPTPAPAPAWLDEYDDESQVTQNLDLKTPPPVSASSIRDRGSSGDDLVPKS